MKSSSANVSSAKTMTSTAMMIIRPVFAVASAVAMMLPRPVRRPMYSEPTASDQLRPAASSIAVRSSGSARGTTTRR